jgi:hypothetical protein
MPTPTNNRQYASIVPPSETGHNDARVNSSPYANPVHRTNTSASRRLSRTSTKEVRDPHLDINLPYRTLTADANLAEYVVEVPSGEIPGPPKPDGKEQYKLVTFTPGDAENPKNWSKLYKWYCTMVVAVTCFVVAFASSVITSDISGMTEEFGVSEEVGLVTITVFVVGFGVGKFPSLKTLVLVLETTNTISRSHDIRSFK